MENIYEFIQKIKNSEIDIVEHTYNLINECKELNKEYNYLNNISEELALNSAREIKIQLKQKNKNIKNKNIPKTLFFNNNPYKNPILFKINIEKS